MPIDPEISLQAKVPSIDTSLAPISSIINLQQGITNLQRSRGTLQSDIRTAAAGARTAEAGAEVTEKTIAPSIQQAQATAQTATANAQEAQLNLLRAHYSNAIQQTTNLINDPNLTRGKLLEEVMNNAKNFNMPSSMIAQVVSQIPDSDDPGILKGYLQKGLITIQDKANQLSAVTPQPSFIQTGQQAIPVNINPLAGPVGQQIGQEVQMQPSVNLPVFTPGPGGIGGTPGYFGPQGKTVQSGPALGAPEAVAGIVGPANTDWAQTVAQAAPAAQNIGVLQNIKQYAPGAVTGVVGDRRSFVAGLAGLLGMSPAQLQKTDTDLLAKNSNMLALAGGNTDAARTMAEAANPNIHMTPEAITHAADQIIAQQQLLLAKQQYMGKFTGNPQAYTQELTKFNAAADPRIFQLRTMPADERAKMKAAMNPQERKDFGDKIRQLEQMGIIQ